MHAYDREPGAVPISSAVDVFIPDKRIQGVPAGVIKKYSLELARPHDSCERQSVYTANRISRELLTGFCAAWEKDSCTFLADCWNSYRFEDGAASGTFKESYICHQPVNWVLCSRRSGLGRTNSTRA